MTATLGQFPPVRRSGVNDAGILRGGQHQGRSTCVAVRGGDAVCIAHFSERVITVCVRTGKSCPESPLAAGQPGCPPELSYTR